MSEFFYPKDGPKHLQRLMDLNRDLFNAFVTFNQKVFAEGRLSIKAKELVAVACAHITRCPYCIDSHIQKAKQAGATDEEISEVIFVAVAMNAGASFAHSCISMESLKR
ncbi:MAG: carboxymuconolactone decarboxylase family protein [Desulfobacterota bacterium]|jgi:AhpD family alkylhydroperoxidase|nr:carboxymuconolactone decarboxylase family protein [Thermodesulfobacteriota bacterium]